APRRSTPPRGCASSRSRPRRWSSSYPTPGRATCASWRTPSSGRWSCATGRASRRRLSRTASGRPATRAAQRRRRASSAYRRRRAPSRRSSSARRSWPRAAIAPMRPRSSRSATARFYIRSRSTAFPVCEFADFADSRENTETMAKQCVGLDIGSSAIKVVALKPQKKGAVALQSFGIEPLPPQTIGDSAVMNPGPVGDAIRPLWSRPRLRQKEVANAAAGQSVIIKKIGVPPMTPDELDEQIPWEAEHHIPFAKDDVEIDYQVTSKQNATGQMELLLVAAKKDVVADYA